jgi:hypothetical protein
VTTYDYVVSDELSALADGAAVTTANMGAVTGLTSLATTLSGTGTVVKIAASNTARHRHGNGVARLELPLTSSTLTMSILYKVTLPTTNPAGDSRVLEVMDSTPTFKLRVNHMSANGQLTLYNAANTAIFNTTPDISGEVYIHLGAEVAAVSPSTSNGKIRFNVYDSTFTLIGSTTYSSDAQNVGVVALKQVRVGRMNTVTDSSDLLTHFVRISDSQITPLDNLSVGATVIAVAGGAYADIEYPQILSEVVVATTGPVLATAMVNPPTVTAAQGASVTAVKATAATGTSTAVVTSGAAQTAVKGTATVGINAPVVSGGAAVTGAAGTASAATVAPTASAAISGSVTGVAATTAAAVRAPALTAGAAVTGVAATATAYEVAPSVASGAAVTGVAVTTLAAVRAPSVMGGVAVQAVKAEASAVAYMGEAGIGITVVAMVATASGESLGVPAVIGFGPLEPTVPRRMSVASTNRTLSPDLG